MCKINTIWLNTTFKRAVTLHSLSPTCHLRSETYTFTRIIFISESISLQLYGSSTFQMGTLESDVNCFMITKDYPKAVGKVSTHTMRNGTVQIGICPLIVCPSCPYFAEQAGRKESGDPVDYRL